MSYPRSVLATIIFLALTLSLSIISIPAALFDRSGRVYLWLTRIWGKIFLLLYGITLDVKGRSHIHKHENYVFISNHSSYTDIPILFAAIPKGVRIILRHTLTYVPIWGWALLASPMIVINRSNAAKARKTLNHAANIIHNGASVLLFPEGTRTSTGEMHAFKRGAFHLAYESGAKVIPVAVKGSFELLSRSAWLPKSNKKVSVTIGAPLEIKNTVTGDRQREIDLMQRAEDAVQKMLSTQSE